MQVIQILNKISPEMEAKMEEAVDIVHRMGETIENKNKNVIILFAHIQVKEKIWRPKLKKRGGLVNWSFFEALLVTSKGST